METLKRLFREDRKEVLSSLLIVVMTLFLSPNGIFLVLLLLLSVTLTLLFLCRWKRRYDSHMKRLASLSFFAAFLSKISLGKGIHDAYRDSTSLLVGYFTPVPLEDIAGMTMAPYELGRFSPYLLYVAKKDASNEAYLPDYRLLLEELQEEIRREESHLEKDRKTRQMAKAMLATFLAVFLLSLALFDGLSLKGKDGMLGLLVLLVASLLVPSIYLSSLMRLGGRKHA